MQLHSPDIYEAHRIRSLETLEHIASIMGLTVEQAIERNWEVQEIEDNVAPPETAPKRRGRKPGTPNAPKVNSQAKQLETALDFISPVETDIADFAQYVNLRNNMAIMYNGQIAAGHPIIEDLNVSPHLDRFKQALKRCGKTLVLTETEAGQLSVKGEKIRVLVPCMTEELAQVVPDPPVLSGDFDILKRAFSVCGTLASEKGERVIEASLLLEANTCTGTNGFTMLQFWHGLSQLPPGTVIPKVFAAAVAAQSKPLTGIGADWSNDLGFARSVTFWFDGGAWLKTQCYNDRWPSIDHILNVTSAPEPVNVGLFDAVDAIIHFLDEGQTAIHLVPDAVQTHASSEVGAQYAVPGLVSGKVFSGKLMKQVAPFVRTIDLTTYPDKAYFFGDNVRGAIMCMVV